MARKSKRMALYEAIRQGQVKIAKGLETGQMRSDGVTHKKKARIEVPDVKALFKRSERIPGIPALSKILAVSSGLAALIVVLFIIGLVMHFTGGPETDVSPTAGYDEQPSQPVIQGSSPEAAQPTQEKDQKDTGFFGLGGKKETKEPAKEEPTVPSLPQGSNVIVIQQIPPDQRDKLIPVQEFFNANGIATEMIQRSGYTLLVSKAGFDYSPYREGTEAYRLFQRIKQLGLTYPEATGDTKFGLKPFQDAYGLNKDK